MNANIEDNTWDVQKRKRLSKLKDAKSKGLDKLIPSEKAIELLETVIASEDKVCIEGNNQKQADFLSECLSQCNPEVLNNLHILQSVLALPSHIDIFDKGIASKVDFSFSGPQALRLAKLVQQQKIHIGSIHTYLELYGRYFIDLTPNVCLITAHSADADGNLAGDAMLARVKRGTHGNLCGLALGIVGLSTTQLHGDAQFLQRLLRQLSETDTRHRFARQHAWA